MNRKFLLKLVAVLLLGSLGYGFAHLIHMGTMPSIEECPHAQDSHGLCNVVLNNQTIEKTVQKSVRISLQVVISLLLIVIPLARSIQKVSKATESNSLPLMQELFSRGILNSKAP